MRFELKLRDIKLHNFRLFDKVEINFDDKLTVLIGENGAGKTALLEGVAKALNVFTEKMKTSLTNVDFRTVYSETDIQYDKTEMTTDIDVHFLETEKLLPEEGSLEDFESQLAFSQSEQDVEKITAKILVQRDKVNDELRQIDSTYDDKDVKDNIDRLNDNIKALEELEEKIASEFFIDELKRAKSKISEWEPLKWRLNKTKTNAEISKFSELKELDRLAKQVHEADRRGEALSLPVVVYYPSVRLAENDTSGQEHDEVFNTYDDALNGNSINFKWLLDWFIFKEDNIETSERLLNAVKDAIFLVLNDDEKVFKEIKTVRTRKKDYRLVVDKGDKKVEVNQLSSGEKSLLVLVADLARRLALANPLSKNPLEEGQGIVLIDEIDLHLHPRWQRAVIPKLQSIFRNIQWVITTHSPQVLGEVEGAKIFILDNKQVRLLDFNTYGKDMNRILDRIMGVPERNEKVLKDFDHYFELIELNELDAAQNFRKQLEEKIGTDEPLFRRADGILKRKQLIGR